MQFDREASTMFLVRPSHRKHTLRRVRCNGMVLLTLVVMRLVVFRLVFVRACIIPSNWPTSTITTPFDRAYSYDSVWYKSMRRTNWGSIGR